MKKRDPKQGSEENYKYPLPLVGQRKDRLDLAASRMDASLKQVLYLVIDIGLEVLENADFNVAKAVVQQAQAPSADVSYHWK